MNAPAQNLTRDVEAANLRHKLAHARVLLQTARMMRDRADEECRIHVNTINAIKQEALERGLSLDPPRKEL